VQQFRYQVENDCKQLLFKLKKTKMMKRTIATLAVVLLTTTAFFIACKKSDTSGSSSSSATVTAFNCSSAVISASATINVAYTGTATVPYTGGNSANYAAGSAISSTGVIGLTATLAAGTLSSSGNLLYNITGTPTSSGTASFAIGFGGQSCSFTITVNAASTTDCSGVTGVAKVVCLANTFLNTLSTAQKASVVLTLNLANAKLWSNLPCGLSCRDGLLFSSLTTAQLAAAKAVIAAATGTLTNQGYDEFSKINSTDSLLGTVAGSGYGSGQYIICFLGTPSTTGKWMLQFGGHHYAGNITFDAGSVVSITPSHQGVEPKTWTNGSGTVIAPLADEQTAVANMLASFSTTELASAKISGTFSDCVMIPGSTTNTFPTTKLGVKVSALSTTAQAMVSAAIARWVGDMDSTSAATFTATYASELANTYVAYASNTSGTSGNASSFFTANTDYVRIDGPSVWIEFICQTGVVYPSQIHYHTVYRDHSRDYIGL
jgi:hypothetical protein